MKRFGMRGQPLKRPGIFVTQRSWEVVQASSGLKYPRRRHWSRKMRANDAYMEKLVPHPQDDVAFGFSITKRAPISSSVKSITAFSRNGSEIRSTTTF